MNASFKGIGESEYCEPLRGKASAPFWSIFSLSSLWPVKIVDCRSSEKALRGASRGTRYFCGVLPKVSDSAIFILCAVRFD